MGSANGKIDAFDFPPGREFLNKYRVIARLGGGWEGEVYKILEIRTGIERTAKFFYPQRNVNDRTSRRCAKKLHKLKDCPILVKYHTEEKIVFRRTPVTAFISEFVKGELLSSFVRRQPGQRLAPLVGLHLLYDLARGVEAIHRRGEYHGDIHDDNIIVSRFGLSFDLKLIDLYRLEHSRADCRKTDIIDMVRVLYDALGGARHYAGQPPAVKYICCGLKQTLILNKFRTMSKLRMHLETMTW
jgi:serine/threonine protein kinase